MTDSAPSIRPPRRRRRHWPWILAAALPILAAGWSGLWFYGAGQVDRAVDAWLEDQRLQGNEWTCASRSLTGFPFELAFSCDQPRWRGDSDAGPAQATAKNFRAFAEVTQPDQVRAQMDGPLAVQWTGSGRQAQVQWADFQVVVAGLLKREPYADLALAKPVVTLADGTAPARSASAASLTLHLNRNPQHPVEDHALDAVLAVSQIASTSLDAALQSDMPADIALNATLTQIHAGEDLSLAEWLEIWRSAGGLVEVTSLTFVKGALKLEGQGRASLDKAHRVQGQVALTATGLEPVLARFGIPQGALNVGGLLSGLLGGGKSGPAGDGLHLALKLEGGKVLLGPLKLPVTLLPLY